MNPAAEAANQRQRDREASSCVHFNGVQNATCKAGLFLGGATAAMENSHPSDI